MCVRPEMPMIGETGPIIFFKKNSDFTEQVSSWKQHKFDGPVYFVVFESTDVTAMFNICMSFKISEDLLTCV